MMATFFAWIRERSASASWYAFAIVVSFPFKVMVTSRDESERRIVRFGVRLQGIWLNWFAPIGAQIKPHRISRDDQLKFADAEPAFKLLLASDRRRSSGEVLEVDEAV